MASENDTKACASKAPRVVDPAFAKRLDQAVNNHPRAPGGHGNQKWLLDQIEMKFGEAPSKQAFHKYFNGTARPRHDLMKRIAEVLQVDEAWLSLGMTPKVKQADKRAHDGRASGAVNLVAAMIQMAGGTIAFQARGDQPDLFAIVQGVQMSVEVVVMPPAGDIEHVNDFVHVSNEYASRIVIAVDLPQPGQPPHFDFYRLTSGVIEEFGRPKGGYVEVKFERKRKSVVVGNVTLPEITDFRNLEGTTSERTKARRALDLD